MTDKLFYNNMLHVAEYLVYIPARIAATVDTPFCFTCHYSNASLLRHCLFIVGLSIGLYILYNCYFVYTGWRVYVGQVSTRPHTGVVFLGLHGDADSRRVADL